jgi:hypothetical protein
VGAIEHASADCGAARTFAEWRVDAGEWQVAKSVAWKFAELSIGSRELLTTAQFGALQCDPRFRHRLGVFP